MKVRLLIFTLIVSCFFVGRGEAASFRELLEARTATCWVEGQVLGDMVIGARARLSFVLVDATLAKSLSGNPEAPDWLVWHGQHYGAKGKTLFVIRFKALKPWNFEPTSLYVGDHQVEKEDIRTRVHFLPQGDLPSGTEATLAVLVPTKALPSGGPIPLGYGEFGIEWTAPR